MKALLLTNEYPPYIYGGAGVHVDYLSRGLAKIMDVEVRCFGDQEIDQPNLSVRGFGVNTAIFRCPKNLNSVFGAIRRCTDFNTLGVDANVVHCHTWYSHFGGILTKLNYHIPLVLTVHSLEPLRPWKREQLGYGYDCSTWLEKTATEMADAVVAVSEETRRDVLRLFNVDPKRFGSSTMALILKNTIHVNRAISWQKTGLIQISLLFCSSVESLGRKALFI